MEIAFDDENGDKVSRKDDDGERHRAGRKAGRASTSH